MDTLKSMRLFVRVAQSKSFKKTADEHHLPAATITLAVQELERELGVRLLHRTTRNVSLTSDGERLLPRILHLIDEWENLNQHQSDAIKGLVRIDVPTRMARRLIIPQLPELLSIHPELQIEIRSTDRAVDLVAEGIDVAIRVGELTDSSLIAKSLGSLDIINCASPAYINAYGLPKDLADLDNHLMIQYSSPTTGKAFEWAYQKDGEMLERPMATRVTVNSAETYIASAIAGLGIIQVPAYDVRTELKENLLIEILSELRPANMPVHAIYTHRTPAPKIYRVIEWIQSLLLAS